MDHSFVMAKSLQNSMKQWAILCRATQDGQVIVKSSDKTWFTGGGKGKPLQYMLSLGSPWTVWKGKKIWHQSVTTAIKLKMLTPWKQSYDKSRRCIKKQRHHFADKRSYSQGYGLSSSHVRMWELDHKEGSALKNWWFWIVVLKSRESLGQQGDQICQS